MADDLVAGGVGDRDLALEDRDERVGLVADLEQLLADRGGALLAMLGQRRELRLREHTSCRTGHPAKATRTRAPRRSGGR